MHPFFCAYYLFNAQSNYSIISIICLFCYYSRVLLIGQRCVFLLCIDLRRGWSFITGWLMIEFHIMCSFADFDFSQD